MYGRKKAPVAGVFLASLALGYGCAVRLRAAAYRSGILKKDRLPIRVISVGNLTLGGTGKTPAVIQIAGLLREKEKFPVVLSRGYGRADESEILVVSNGRNIVADPAKAGDEPSLIGLRLAGVPVVVGKDRFRAGMAAIDRFRPDVAVLDDGFQHLRLHRDLDIVLVDGADPFGKTGKLFPAGILREPPAALARAGAVLITRADRTDDLAALKAEIRRYTDAPVFTSRYVPRELVDVSTGEVRALAALRGTRVVACSGIARPEAFSELLRGLKAEPAARVTYPDHYPYTRSDLAALYQKAVDTKAAMILTTEKDAVRLKGLKPEGIWAVRIDMEVVENDAWQEVLCPQL